MTDTPRCLRCREPLPSEPANTEDMAHGWIRCRSCDQAYTVELIQNADPDIWRFVHHGGAGGLCLGVGEGQRFTINDNIITITHEEHQ